MTTTTALVAALGWTLLDFLWQGALIGFATACALVLLHNARPQLRYLVACSALLLCLAWPAAELFQRLGVAGASDAAARWSSLGTAPGLAPGLEWVAAMQDKLAWIVVTWAVCAAALALRMAAGVLWIERASRSRRADAQWQARLGELAIRFGVTRKVGLRIVDGLESPLTAGWLRPVVLVPASLVTGMPPQLLEALLAHEMAHVKRFDYLVNLGQNVIETLLFYHPAVWWISRRIRVEREQIADDLAARQLGEPRRLALALSELERLQFSTHHLAQAANGGDLMTRIKRLVRPDTQALNWKAAVPVLGLAVLCAGVSAQATATADVQPVAKPDKEAIAKFESCAKPVYPKEEIQLKHEGKVALRFLVDTDGKVSNSAVLKSSGYPALDAAAHTALVKCSFQPALKDGKPVPAWTAVQYIWSLK